MGEVGAAYEDVGEVGGLGGKPYRSGSYEYYVGEKVQEDDPKGVGAYLMAGVEVGRLGR